MAEHPWNALCLLKHRVQGSDSNVSPPVFVELLRLHRHAKESPIELVLLKAELG